MSLLTGLARKKAAQNPRIKRWVTDYLRLAPGVLYEMIKETVGRDSGLDPDDVTHVVVILGGSKTAYTTGGCVHASGPIPGQGRCEVPSHLYIGCEFVMEDLRSRHPDLDELVANSRADMARRAAAQAEASQQAKYTQGARGE